MISLVDIMAKKNVMKESCKCGKFDNWHNCGGLSAVYGLGFIGAVIYYICTATGFWMGVLGVLKAFVWPVFLVYHTLVFLGA